MTESSTYSPVLSGLDVDAQATAAKIFLWKSMFTPHKIVVLLVYHLNAENPNRLFPASSGSASLQNQCPQDLLNSAAAFL
jgi:hypothetical protein